jgi:translocation and assembly module TamB
MSRFGVWTALVVCWVAGCVLGITGVALRTEAGRELLGRTVVNLVNRNINGTLSIGELDGSFVDGLEARDITIHGPYGLPILELERLQLRYRVADLLSRRIVLGQLILDKPRVNFTRLRPGEPFNFELLFPPGSDGGDGPTLLVAFSDVQIVGGSFVVRTPADAADSSSQDVEAGPEGPLVVRRIDRIFAEFPYLRLASPRGSERGIFGDIATLEARVSDPAMDVAHIRGRARFVDDSLIVDLPAVHLGHTRAAVQGALSFTDGLLFDLEIAVDRVVTDELQALVPELPAGLAMNTDVRIQATKRGAIEVDARDLSIEGFNNGGTASGRLGLVVGPGDALAFRDAALDLRNFDLEYIRGFIDTLPVAGRVTGSWSATGPEEHLRVELDVLLRDSLVEGWPESRIRGGGHLILGGGDLQFEEFAVDSTTLDLGTVRRLLPSVALEGELWANGTLRGPWREMQFDGALRHQDALWPQSALRGSLRVDARDDPVGLWADVQLDSLRLAGLRPSYPGIPIDGNFAGRMVLAGYFDSLGIEGQLGGPAGQVSLAGAVVLHAGSLGTRPIRIQASQLNLRPLRAGLPTSTLRGAATVAGMTGEETAGAWSVELALEGSQIEDVPFDSVRAVFIVADSLLRADTLHVWAEGIRVSGGGQFGITPPHTGVLSLLAEADAIGILEPLLARALGEPDSAFIGVAPEGAVRVLAEFRGGLDAFDVDAEFEADSLRRAEAYVSHLQGRARWTSPFENAAIEAAVDSAHLGALAFTGMESRISGRSDSLAWFGRARFGDVGGWIGGGRLRVDSSQYRVPIDSMVFLLSTGAWFVDTAAVVVVSDSGVDFSNVRISSASSPSNVTMEGRLPFRGPADLRGTFQEVSVRDISLLVQKYVGEVDGELSGRMRLGGTARAPILDATAALRDGVFQTLQIPYLDGGLRYEDRRLDGDFALWRQGQRFLEVNMRLPMDLALAAVEERRPPGPLMVRAVADSMPVSLIEALLPVMRRGSGTLSANLGIDGTWEEPTLFGRVAIKDGAASFPTIGVRHEELNASLTLNGETIDIEHLTLKSGRGSARVTGSVRLEELTNPILDLRIDAQEFHAVSLRDFLTLTATADLQLRGPPLGATLTGNGTTTRGVLFFADLITKRVISLEDTLFAEFVDTAVIREQRLGAAFQRRFLDSLRVQNLRMRMGEDVWLRSSDANIQLAGDIIVNKTGKQYRLNGTLLAQRGTYRLPLGPVTRDFTVTRGEVRYFGTPDLNADVDIDGRHVVRSVRAEDVTVFVHIGGTLYQPRATLSSDIRPPLSEPEIISYLLFGAPSVQALAGSSAESQGLVDRSVSQLAGVLSGQLEYALIADLGVPLDYVQIRPGDIGRGLSGTEIALGKQFTLLGTTAFLTASPRICPTTTVVGASLEFRLTRRWLFAASADPVRGCDQFTTTGATYQFGLDLLWEKSY